MPNLPILREHWRLLEPMGETDDSGEPIESGDEYLHRHPRDWRTVPATWIGKKFNAAVVRRRVPALPTCETCGYVTVDASGVILSCLFHARLVGSRDYCSKHSALNKAQEERG